MIKGIIVPNITLFDKNGEVNLKKMKEHMEWMVKKGVDGFFLTGSYGSGPLMTAQEKINIYNIAKEIQGKYKHIQLIANVGCNNTKNSLLLAKEANDMGITNIASTAPYYYSYTNKDVLAYFEEIRDNTMGSVYIYNNPKTTGFKVNVDFLEMLNKIGVNGIKDSTLDCEIINAICYENKSWDDFQYIAGTSTGWPILNKAGIRAMIAGMANYAPEIVVKLWRSSGDNELCRKYYSQMMRLNREIKTIDSTILSVAALKIRGIDEIYVRKPMRDILNDSNIYANIENNLMKELKKVLNDEE